MLYFILTIEITPLSRYWDIKQPSKYHDQLQEFVSLIKQVTKYRPAAAGDISIFNPLLTEPRGEKLFDTDIIHLIA